MVPTPRDLFQNNQGRGAWEDTDDQKWPQVNDCLATYNGVH